MSDIYRIAVALQMTSNHAGVLSALSSHLLGVHKDVGKLNAELKSTADSFSRIKLAAAGLGSVFAGAGILEGLKKVAEHGEKLLDQQDKLIRAGRTQFEVASLTAKAYGEIARQVPTATAADALRVAGQLNVVMGDFKSAVASTAQSLKIESILGNVTGKSAEGAGHAIWRSLEMKGLTSGSDANKLIGERLMESFVQNIGASGGKLTANDYQGMAKRGATAWARATPEFLAGPMSVVAADLGGDTAGTALSTAYNFLTSATQLSKQQFAALSKIDMIDKRHVKMGPGGSFLAEPGAIRGGLEDQGDLYHWVQDWLIPHMNKAGIHEGAERNGLIAQIGRNKNSQRMFTMFSDPEFVAQIEKDIRVFHQSMGIDKAYQDYITNDPKGVKEAYNGQYESMMEAIGAPMMKAALPVMREITSVFTQVGELANKNPEAVKAIGQGLAIMGASLVGAGATALLAAIGPAGWIAGGVIGLTAAAAAWKPDLFSKAGAEIKTFFSEISVLFSGEAWSKTWTAITSDIAKLFSSSVAKLPDLVGQDIANTIAKIGSMFTDSLKKLFQIQEGHERLPGQPPAAGSQNPLAPGTGTDWKSIFGGVSFETGGSGAAGSPMADAVYVGVLRAFNELLGKGGGVAGSGGGIVNASFNPGNDNYSTASGVARALGRGGPGGIGIVPDSVPMTEAERNTLGLIQKYESGGRNVPNYMFDRRHTAQGLYQITNSNWHHIAPLLGIHTPDAMHSSPEDQAWVALYLLRHSGVGNWTSKVAQALHRGEHAPIGVHTPAPTASAPPKQPREEVHIHNVYLDGDKIERHVTRRQVAKMRFPTSVGGTDSYGNWHGPATAGTKVA